MSLGILLAIGGHISNAIAALIDRYLLKAKSPHPAVYAVVISSFSLIALFAWPFFGIEVIGWQATVQAMVFGASFFAGLWVFFQGLEKSEAGMFVPLTAASVALFTILTEILLYWSLPTFTLKVDAGIGLFILSLVFIALANRQDKRSVALTEVVSSGIFFALASVNAHLAYEASSFAQGFFYSRIAMLVCVFTTFLCVPRVRDTLFTAKKQENTSITLFFTGQLFGAVGFILVQYAYALAQPSIVNALQAIQFGCIAIITGVAKRWIPEALHETWHGRVGIYKILALLCIAGGLGLLTFV